MVLAYLFQLCQSASAPQGPCSECPGPHSHPILAPEGRPVLPELLGRKLAARVTVRTEREGKEMQTR